MKRFLPLAVIVIGLLILLFAVRQCRQRGAANFQTAPVTRGPLTQVVTATGTLNPVVNVQVGSQVSGNIAKLFADFNSQVKAGQVVAQIDPALFQATVTQAEGDLANAQAALELAKVNAARTQELFAKKNSSQQDLDQAMANLHQAEASVKIKQGALDKAKADLDHCTITSPVDGVVISRNVDVGQTVAASLQAPITVQNVVTYDTVIGVSNPDLKLKPGMTANVSIIVAHRDNVLQIKNAALRYRPADATPTETRASSAKAAAAAGSTSSPSGARPSSGRERRSGERTVYVLSGSRPHPVQIKTGISNGIVTEVTEGLKEADRVVTAELTSSTAAASPGANPFSGGRRFP